MALALAGLLGFPSAQLRAAATLERHHVIVLVDRSGSMLGKESELGYAIQDRLQHVCFERGVVFEGNGPALLDPDRGDVLSILSFGLDTATARSFDRFIAEPFPQHALRRADAPRSIFNDFWSHIQTRGSFSFFTRSWTGLSLAMPLALEYQGSSGAATAEPVTRTFLILVTDDEYNGGDPSLELDGLSVKLAGRDPPSRLLAPIIDVRERMERVQDLYRFKRLYSDSSGRKVYLRVFEAVPRARTFGIESVWRFEPTFHFRRVPNGFRSAFPLSQVRESLMLPLRTEALLMDGDSILQVREPTGDSIRFDLPPAAVGQRGLRVRLRFWVRQADSVYGMQALSPDGSLAQGSGGLVRTLPVVLEPPAPVLGFIPLPFLGYRAAAAFGVRSQEGAAWFWSFVLLLFLAGILLVWLRWASTSRSAGDLENEIRFVTPSTRSRP